MGELCKFMSVGARAARLVMAPLFINLTHSMYQNLSSAWTTLTS